MPGDRRSEIWASKYLAQLPASLETASIQRDRRADTRVEAADSDRRKHDRAQVDAPASLCISFRNGFAGRLTNLSTHGCRLELHAGVFAVGDDVWFRLEQFQAWKGVVRWISRGEIGVEFERPFYPSVFELIVATNKPVTCSRAA